MLPLNEFKQLIKLGSLFSIDLIVMNEIDEVLLGLRKNYPAKGYWFVPGSRTFRNETLDEAIKRISKIEIGIDINKDELKPIGLYDHIYQDNFFNETGFGTHYIVLACRVSKRINEFNLPVDHHEKYKFFNIQKLLNSNDVHKFTKNYFIDSPDNLFMRF